MSSGFAYGSGSVSVGCSMRVIKLRVAEGDNNASPCATARTARASSSGSDPLPINPLAPARSAATIFVSFSNVVRINTRVAAKSGSPQIFSVAAIPSSSGMRISMSTTSG